MNDMTKGTHHLLLVWLILSGLILFALYISWDTDLLALLFASDRSRISWLIALLYLLVTFHCARRIYRISSQLNASITIEQIIHKYHHLYVKAEQGKLIVNDETALPECLLTEYIYDLVYKARHENINDDSGKNHELIEVYESRLKNPHEIGWFLSDVMIKLGLLGTIVGFVLMLGSVADVTDIDVASIQSILKNMSSGMGTALYTTFAGLICSILAGIQYHLLDQAADELIDTAKHLSQVYIIPKLKSSG